MERAFPCGGRPRIVCLSELFTVSRDRNPVYELYVHERSVPALSRFEQQLFRFIRKRWRIALGHGRKWRNDDRCVRRRQVLLLLLRLFLLRCPLRFGAFLLRYPLRFGAFLLRYPLRFGAFLLRYPLRFGAFLL